MRLRQRKWKKPPDKQVRQLTKLRRMLLRIKKYKGSDETASCPEFRIFLSMPLVRGPHVPLQKMSCGCPARDKICRKCNRKGHFQDLCLTRKRVATMEGRFILAEVDGVSRHFLVDSSVTSR